MLIERGANVHDRTRAGWDSLMIASRYGIVPMVEQLLYAAPTQRRPTRTGAPR
jgi:ankyrin repeat protein